MTLSEFFICDIEQQLQKVCSPQIALGTHHYVQLAESDILRQSDPEEFDSVEMIVPAGAAVPQSCQAKFKEKMRNLKVSAMVEANPVSIFLCGKAQTIEYISMCCYFCHFISTPGNFEQNLLFFENVAILVTGVAVPSFLTP